MSYNKLFITLTVLMLIFAACRKQWNPTEEDMANYGWTLFELASEQADFEEVLDWFFNATMEDTNYQDGYNGLGWTYGKLSSFISIEGKDVELEDAVKQFLKGEDKKENPRMEHNVRHDIRAGLTFAYSGLRNDSMAIIYGDLLISELEENRETWAFPREPLDNEGNYPTDYLDVHITLALAKFVRSTTVEDFNEVEKHVDAIITARSMEDFNSSYETLAGQQRLSAMIDSLQTILK